MSDKGRSVFLKLENGRSFVLDFSSTKPGKDNSFGVSIKGYDEKTKNFLEFYAKTDPDTLREFIRSLSIIYYKKCYEVLESLKESAPDVRATDLPLCLSNLCFDEELALYDENLQIKCWELKKMCVDTVKFRKLFDSDIL